MLSPENTIQAAHLALQQGATGLEVDVRLSRDREVVLLHDPYLLRHFRKWKPVAATPLAELQQLQFSDNGYAYKDQICTLAAFLEEFRATVPINLDAKFWGVRPHLFAHKLVRLVDRMRMHDQVWISSFNPFLVRKIKDIKPTVRTGYLFQDPVRVYQMIDPFLDSDAWHPHHKNATPRLIEKAHRLKKEIYIWTVNDPAVLQRIEPFEFHGIITDTFFRQREISAHAKPPAASRQATPRRGKIST